LPNSIGGIEDSKETDSLITRSILFERGRTSRDVH
jgi:hypothetical protein